MITLLEKINDGKFSRSKYYDLLEKEKASLEKRLKWAKEYYKDSPSVLNEILQRENSRFETKRRSYLERLHKDELRILFEFRKELLKEFEIDLWDEVFLNHSPETELEVYYLYKKLGNFENTVSEIYAKLNKSNNKA
jgi:hypothetical protein